ncbi:MAG: polyphosphate kinase 1, partial [Oscillospiraceae bacterium]|nr:polyphosphate kinase 1 [Oscillospiraceae bacterium]
GCIVMYGPEHLKVHSKLLLITRKNGNDLQFVTQIGTGNYNEKTSELYTDLSLLTSDIDIGTEASRVFHALSIGNLVENTSSLMVAPLALRSKVTELIDYEIAKVKNGGVGYLGFKLNSLTDKVIMDKLIEASCAGVKVDMVIRGICCLVPGIEGRTENITVRSIVGRYLEHSRIYIFGKDDPRVYISSADFMTRNTTRRVEVAAPIRSKEIRQRVLDIFDVLMRDDAKARMMLPDGSYVHVPPNEDEHMYAQNYFEQQARSMAFEAAQRRPVKPMKATAVKVRRRKDK